MMGTNSMELVRKSSYLWKYMFPRVGQVRSLSSCHRLRRKEERYREDTAGAHPCVVRSNYPEIDIPNVAVHELIFENLQLWEEKTAVECSLSGKKWTYIYLYKTSRALAKSMMKRFKLEKGDRVAVILPNCPEYLAVLLAASMTGIVVTTINPAYTPVEISRQLKDTDSKLVVTVAENHEKCSKALTLVKSNIPVVIAKIQEDTSLPAGSVSLDELADPSLAGNLETSSAASGDDVFVLPYSSGTSGLPKGVELTHKNIVANLLQYRISHKMKLDQGSGQCSILGVLPMFHIYGMVIIAMDAISEGDRLVSLPKFEPEPFVDAIYKKQTNLLYLVPPLVFFLSNSDAIKPKHLNHVQHIVTGAAPCGETDLEKLLKKGKHMKIAQGYGMTETSPVITMTHKARFDKISSVGHPMPSTLIKVTDVNTGRPLRQGEKGQINVKGPQVMKGYLNRPQETRNTFDDEGWLKTGDIGYYDEDNDLFVVDRLKELIKVKGFQVAPAELEEFVRSHPKVADVGVIGVRHAHQGEVPKAFVVVKNGVSCTEEEIRSYVKENLSAYKELTGGVRFVKEIPKSGAGKILRNTLKEMNEKSETDN